MSKKRHLRECESDMKCEPIQKRVKGQTEQMCNMTLAERAQMWQVQHTRMETSDSNSREPTDYLHRPTDYLHRPTDYLHRPTEYLYKPTEHSHKPVEHWKKRKYQHDNDKRDDSTSDNNPNNDTESCESISIHAIVSSLCSPLPDHVSKPQILELITRALNIQSKIYEQQLQQQQDVFDTYTRDAFKQYNCRDEYRLTYIS
jgi:hypothetical protein